MRAPLLFLMAATLLLAGPAGAQEADTAPRWAFGLSAYGYRTPEDGDYLQPTLRADRGRLHLEARYNYEDLDTASLWAGWAFRGGGALTAEFTPMLGVVSGDTDGLAPGYALTLGYGDFEFYSEGEYLFEAEDSAADFLYAWNELTYAPLEWLWFGVAAQRTRTYDTGLDVQRGLLLGLTAGGVELILHAFNPGGDDRTYVVALGWGN